MVTDIVIPYQLSENGIELRYALRSAEKHLKGIGEVILIGDHPAWFNGWHVPFTQRVGNIVWKQRIIFEKVMAACACPEISDTFLFMNDDHYLLRDYDAATFPWYFDNLMDMWIEHRAHGDYKITLENTAEIVGVFGLYADVHCPCVYDKERFAALAKLDWTKPHGYAIKSCYLNEMQDDRYDYNSSGELVNETDYVRCTDTKLRYPMDRWELDKNLDEREWFSTTDRCFNPPLRGLMEELYPTKSKWEK